MQDKNELVRIRNDGWTSHNPGGVFRSFCKLDIFLFPYDVQKCEMVFEAWRYNMKKQYFAQVVSFIDEQFFESEEWAIVDIRSSIKIHNYTTGYFDQVIVLFFLVIKIDKFKMLQAVVTLVVKRKTEYFALTAMLPCLLIGGIELITFLVPYDQTVRLDLSFTCLLAYSMFKIMITSDLPQSAEPPLLLLLISLFTVYIGVAILFQGICIHFADLAKQRGKRQPSRFLQRLASKASNLVGCNRMRKSKNGSEVSCKNGGRKSSEIVNDVDDMPEIQVESEKHVDWDIIAKIVDKIGFFTFLFLLIGTTVALLLIIPGAYNWGME